MTDKIDDKKYLKYLYQSLNLDDLKLACKNLGIKGYSKYKKAELVDFFIDSISEEEIANILNNEEIKIISAEIDSAINKINGTDPRRETISAIRIKNPDRHEVEIDFKGFNWETSSYLSITEDNLADPDRDCDCRVGSEGGLCPHFWVGFIFSLKQHFFNLDDWIMTKLPEDLEDRIKTINISTSSLGDEAQKGAGGVAAGSISMVDKSSASSKISKFLDSRVTIYEGLINKITERQSDFQGHVTKYYILGLENVKIGPQLERKSDYDENAIEEIPKLNIRASDKNFEQLSLTEGEKVTCNGTLSKDNYWDILLKRVSKLKKVKELKDNSS